jgi:hypothetical protein
MYGQPREVLSGECELGPVCRMFGVFMQHKAAATRQVQPYFAFGIRFLI